MDLKANFLKLKYFLLKSLPYTFVYNLKNAKQYNP